MVSFEGFSRAGGKEQIALLKSGGAREQRIGKWVEDVFMKQIGLDSSDNPYDFFNTSLEAGARTLAKFGLSFPTAGTKNVLTGQTQTLFAQNIIDWGRGVFDVLGADA